MQATTANSTPSYLRSSDVHDLLVHMSVSFTDDILLKKYKAASKGNSAIVAKNRAIATYLLMNL